MHRRQIKWALALAVALLAGLASSASAAILTGGSDDPQDAPVVAGSSERAADVRDVRVIYNEYTGDLAVSAGLYPYAADHVSTIVLDAQLGSLKPGVGCVAGQDDVSLEVIDAVDAAVEDGGPFEYSTLEFKSPSGSSSYASGNAGFDRSTRRYTAAFEGVDRLVGLGVRCVSAIEAMMYGYTSDSVWYDTKDEIESFCLDDHNCKPRSPRDEKAPAVSWVKPSEGATVSGTFSGTSNCLVNAIDASGIDLVDFSADGRFVQTQTDAPWSCDISTWRFQDGPHTLTATAFDEAGNSASSTITVNVENNATPIGTVAPTITPTETVTPSPTPVIEVVHDTDASRLEVSTGRTRTGKALMKRFGRAYRKRKHFDRDCASKSRRVVSCHVAWHYKRRAYKGKVRVRLLDSGRYQVEVAVEVRKRK